MSMTTSVLNVWDKQKENTGMGNIVGDRCFVWNMFFAIKSTFSSKKGKWVFATQMGICCEVKFSH